MEIVLLGILILGPLLCVIGYTIQKLEKSSRRLSRKLNTGVFDHYVDGKRLFMQMFGKVPSYIIIHDVDMSKAYGHVTNNFSHLILDQFQACWYNRSTEQTEFNLTIFVLKNDSVIELGYGHFTIFYPGEEYGFANALAKAISEYKIPEKVEDYEINIISCSGRGMELKPLKINPTKLDLCLNYNDDFIAVDQLIRSRLNKENDKGIVLLHGLPGTGKTTYLRHLIGDLKKKVLFVSPSAAANLMNPDFIDLLIDNPNSILVIEDAENIMMDRKFNSDSSVSNLLNMTDGLLNDCLNVQIICTFNSKLNMIDPALMRKGRLIARYEFEKLNIEKAQKLSEHFGFDTIIHKPMTIAEIANQHDRESGPDTTSSIGFMRAGVMSAS